MEPTERLALDADWLEEHLLRALYEGPASLEQCLAQFPTHLSPDGLEALVGGALGSLRARGCIEAEQVGAAIRYRLSPAGSERLAVLAEASESEANPS